MTALFALLPIFGYALVFNIFANKKVSVSIFFAISLIIVTIFTFGILDILKYGTYLIFYGGILTLIYFIIMKKENVLNFILSIPFIIYLVTSIVYLYLMQGAQLFFWDEYSHWGASIKEMYHFGHFYSKDSSILSHLHYPPGIQVWEYFILLPAGYKESSLYFAYFLVLFSSVLMMYERLKWNQMHWIILIFITQMVLFATYGHWFSSIYIDHVVGAMFAGLILSYLVDRYTFKSFLFFLLPLSTIVLFKEIGLFFGLGFLGLVFLLKVHENYSVDNRLLIYKNFKIFLYIMFFLISMLLTLKLWSSSQNLSESKNHSQSMISVVTKIITGEKILEPSIEKELQKRFWEVVKSQQLHKEKISLNYNEFSYGIMEQYKKELKLSTIGSFIFYISFVFLVVLTMQDRNIRNRSIIIGGYLLFVSIIYLFILYFSFHVAFGNGALRIPSFVRYMNMAVLPMFFVAFFMLLPIYEEKFRQNILKDTINIKLIVLVVALAIFTFITQPYFKPLYSQLDIGFRENIEQTTSKILERIPMKSKVLVVFPIKNNGSLNNILKYSMIPAIATVTKYDFFEKTSKKKVLQEYAKYDYIWFASFTKSVLAKSKVILKQKDQKSIYTLYKLEKNKKQIRISPIL